MTSFIITKLGAFTNTVGFIPTVMVAKIESAAFSCGRFELAASSEREAELTNAEIKVDVGLTLVDRLNDLVADGAEDLSDVFRGAAADLSNRCDIHGNKPVIKDSLVHISDVFTVLSQFEDGLWSGAVDKIVGAGRRVKSIGPGEGSEEERIYDTALVALGLNKFVGSSPDLHSELDLIAACILLIFR